MKVLTVKDLKNEMEKLIQQGLGDRIVMIPNDDMDELDQDFRIAGRVDTNDALQICVYLQPSPADVEAEFWREEWEV